MLADPGPVPLQCGGMPQGSGRHFGCKSRDTAHGIERKLEAIEVVQYDHVEGRGGAAFLLVATYVDVGVIATTVSELVDHRRIAMERKDDRAILREHRIELGVRQAMRMLQRRLQ